MNFVVSCWVINVGIVLECGKFSPEFPQKSIKIMSLQSCDFVFYFRFQYPLKFWNFFVRIIGADSKSAAVFYIRGSGILHTLDNGSPYTWLTFGAGT